jgi:hypothetical protein
MGAIQLPLIQFSFRFMYPQRQETFRAVGKLQGILHCIQQLDPPALERFATTQVIQCVIDQSIQQPLVVGLLAFDILLHIIVMLGTFLIT